MSLIIVLTNISSLAAVSDYNYEVLIGDGTPARSTTLAHGTLKGHTRSDGWKRLVEQLLNKETSEEDTFLREVSK